MQKGRKSLKFKKGYIIMIICRPTGRSEIEKLMIVGFSKVEFFLKSQLFIVCLTAKVWWHSNTKRLFYWIGKELDNK